MRLKASIKELIDRKFGTQTALAEALNPMPEGVARCKPADIQRLASAGRNQEKQFAIFIKLMPLLVEQGLVSAYELLPRSRHVDGKANLEPGKTSKVKTGTR